MVLVCGRRESRWDLRVPGSWPDAHGSEGENVGEGFTTGIGGVLEEHTMRWC